MITVIGGGLAGLVAAIEVAEAGRDVRLLEARVSLGGRAGSSAPPHVADQGPHALYPPSTGWEWLERRGLLPATTKPLRRGYRVVQDSKMKTISGPYLRAVTSIRGDAPINSDFMTWATRKAGSDAARAAASVLIAFTYDHDPGRLSAAFCAERFRRLVSPTLKVRYVIGGWQRLVDALEDRALSLGVRIARGTHARELPNAPVIIATDPRNASLLLKDETLSYSTGRAAALAVAIRPEKRPPTVVFDLEHPTVAVRHSSVDPSLVPAGQELIEAATGFAPSETLDAAVRRIEHFLDLAFGTWREHEAWRKVRSFDMGAGAVDLPGHTWRDRPAIRYGEGIFVAGDWVSAPGILSDVAFNSAIQVASEVVRLRSQTS